MAARWALVRLAWGPTTCMASKRCRSPVAVTRRALLAWRVSGFLWREGPCRTWLVGRSAELVWRRRGRHLSAAVAAWRRSGRRRAAARFFLSLLLAPVRWLAVVASHFLVRQLVLAAVLFSFLFILVSVPLLSHLAVVILVWRLGRRRLLVRASEGRWAAAWRGWRRPSADLARPLGASWWHLWRRPLSCRRRRFLWQGGRRRLRRQGGRLRDWRQGGRWRRRAATLAFCRCSMIRLGSGTGSFGRP